MLVAMSPSILFELSQVMELAPQMKQKKMKISRKSVENLVENLSKHLISSLWYPLNQDYNLDYLWKVSSRKDFIKILNNIYFISYAELWLFNRYKTWPLCRL